MHHTPMKANQISEGSPTTADTAAPQEERGRLRNDVAPVEEPENTRSTCRLDSPGHAWRSPARRNLDASDDTIFESHPTPFAFLLLFGPLDIVDTLPLSRSTYNPSSPFLVSPISVPPSSAVSSFQGACTHEATSSVCAIPHQPGICLLSKLNPRWV
ncbi:hypothetical protein BKA93DRAFT_218199 [Sparassis latifolia]